MLQKTKVFMSGTSQAIRIPKEFRFKDKEVFIKKIGDIVILIPERNNIWTEFFKNPLKLSENFLKERNI